jgi:hypothetical protein
MPTHLIFFNFITLIHNILWSIQFIKFLIM